LRQIFERRSDWSFVFIGLDQTPEHLMSEDLKAFQRLPNVHVIGRRTLQEIPSYLKGCDVCAIPWVINELSLSGSPLKLYEYLASGRPVVSTPLQHLLPLDGVIAFASNANEWIEAIEAALRSGGPGTIDARQSIARENTWEKKVDFISQKVAQELALRREA
jgi:glycosyltransferase involved in cell wall biosynthesis